MPSLALGLGLSKNKTAVFTRGGFIGLLDTYPNAAQAYSLRKLRLAYAGSAVKIRRSGDNSEFDFGFNSDGSFDSVGAVAFCIAGGGTQNGFIVTWYDQSGNGVNDTQTTAANQPQIVSSGAIITDNLLPSTLLDGSNDSFNATVANGFFGNNSISVFVVTKNSSSAETGGILQKRDAATDGNFGIGVVSGKYQFQTRDAATADLIINTVSTYNTQQIISVIRKASGIYMFSPETLSTLGGVADLTSSGPLETGNGSSYGFLGGNIQELIVYLTDQTSNETGIRGNINTYYDVY